MTMLVLGSLVGTLLGWLLGFLSLFLILLILIQRGKGGGLTGALGGPGGQSAFGSKAGDTFTLITIVVASLWGFTCVLTIMLLGTGQSLPSVAAAPTVTAGPRDESESDSPKGLIIPPSGGISGGQVEPSSTTGSTPSMDLTPAPPASSQDAPTDAAPTDAAPTDATPTETAPSGATTSEPATPPSENAPTPSDNATPPAESAEPPAASSSESAEGTSPN
jgi:preprotein translocase subunit SecG